MHSFWMCRVTGCALLFAAALGVRADLPMNQAAAQPPAARQRMLRSQLDKMGHRNWIAVVDSAYPAQTAPGIKMLRWRGDHLTVVQEVLNAVEQAPHVSGILHVDQELAFVSAEDAPGIDAYRKKLKALLEGRTVCRMLHEDIITNLDEAAEDFQVLILKTEMALPYTSVFIRLDCGYWNAEAEDRLRARMKQADPSDQATQAQPPRSPPS